MLIDLGEELSFTDNDAALNYLEQSLALLKKHDYPEKHAWALNYYGYALMVAGKYDEARNFLHQAVQHAKKLDKPKLTSRCLVDIATTYYYEARIEEALSYCEKGLFYLKEFPKNQAIVYNNMGIFSKNAGDYEQANDYYINALKCFEKIKDTALMISAQNNIASLFNHIKFYDRALYYHNQALELCEKTNNIEGLARGCNGLALVQDNLGMDEQSIKNNKEAIKIFKELGLTKELLSTRYNLADFYYSRKKYNEALTIFNSVRPEFDRINAIPEYAITTNAIGLIHFQNKNFEKAQLFLEEAYELQKHIENPSMYKSMLLNLSELYESIGEFDKAFETNAKYELVKDSLLVLEKAEKIATKEALFRYEKMSNELQINADKLAEEKKRTSSTSDVSNILVVGLSLLLVLSIILIYFYARGRKKKNQSKELNESAQADLASLELVYEEIYQKVNTMRPDQGEASWIHLLSKRELEVLTCLGTGMTDTQIGDKLFVSVATVNSHCSRIYKKLDVKNRTEAASVVRGVNLI